MRNERTRKLTSALLLASLVLCTSAAPAAAHGAGHVPVSRILDGGAVAVEFGLSSGESLPGVAVRVIPPEDGASAAVRLDVRTDQHGRAAFVPDRPGIWRLVATDAEGHVATASVEVLEGAVISPPSPWRRWLLRASLLANLVLLGLLLHWSFGRRPHAHGHHHNHDHDHDHLHTHTHHGHEHVHALSSLGKAGR